MHHDLLFLIKMNRLAKEGKLFKCDGAFYVIGDVAKPAGTLRDLALDEKFVIYHELITEQPYVRTSANFNQRMIKIDPFTGPLVEYVSSEGKPLLKITSKFGAEFLFEQIAIDRVADLHNSESVVLMSMDGHEGKWRAFSANYLRKRITSICTGAGLSKTVPSKLSPRLLAQAFNLGSLKLWQMAAIHDLVVSRKHSVHLLRDSVTAILSREDALLPDYAVPIVDGVGFEESLSDDKYAIYRITYLRGGEYLLTYSQGMADPAALLRNKLKAIEEYGTKRHKINNIPLWTFSNRVKIDENDFIIEKLASRDTYVDAKAFMRHQALTQGTEKLLSDKIIKRAEWKHPDLN